MRDRMIELIEQKQVYGVDQEQERPHEIALLDNDVLADHLLANGVIVQNAETTVDFVEVVRCKDCAKDGLSTCPICYIENHTLQFINHDPDFFCGYGEKK